MAGELTGAPLALAVARVVGVMGDRRPEPEEIGICFGMAIAAAFFSPPASAAMAWILSGVIRLGHDQGGMMAFRLLDKIPMCCGTCMFYGWHLRPYWERKEENPEAPNVAPSAMDTWLRLVSPNEYSAIGR